jgi:hypothetical protein
MADLLGSLYKEIIETLLLTELIAPPTMTDETELAIAGVTSLHESPRGSAAKMVVTITCRNGPIAAAEMINFSQGVIAMQRSCFSLLRVALIRASMLCDGSRTCFEQCFSSHFYKGYWLN